MVVPVALLLPGSGTAAAEPVTVQAVGGPAKLCVASSTNRRFVWREVHVRNNCKLRVRVKALISGDKDSACHQLDSREGFTYEYRLWAQFDGLVNC
jgi:hypothetical protein